ncbi:MAG: hypothetical protein ACYTHM_20385, partial [Planctomycetota bacterium]
HRGKRSPECRNVVLGQAIETLDEVYDRLPEKAAVLRFVKRQLGNSRESTAKKARRFLERHGP